jgi:hypothetical protein
LILNEANCVTGDKYLEASGTGVGSDTGMIGTAMAVNSLSGRVQGNGNNWLELLVAGDDGDVNHPHSVNLQGYQIQWTFAKPDDETDFGSGTITFSDNPVFAHVPQGTIITISEFQKLYYANATDSNDGHGGHKRWVGRDGYGTDHAYVSGKTFSSSNGTLVDFSTDANVDPENGDFNMQIFAGDTVSGGVQVYAQTGTDDNDDPIAYSDYFVFQGFSNQDGVIGVDEAAGLFVANNDNWGMRIVDTNNANAVVEDWVGEAEANYGGGGVSSQEMFKLQKVATDETGHATFDYTNPGDHYNEFMADGKESTMGAANKWSAGSKTQDLTSPRAWAN